MPPTQSMKEAVWEDGCGTSASSVWSRIYLTPGLASPLWIKPHPAIHPEDDRLADLF